MARTTWLAKSMAYVPLVVKKEVAKAAKEAVRKEKATKSKREDA